MSIVDALMLSLLVGGTALIALAWFAFANKAADWLVWRVNRRKGWDSIGWGTFYTLLVSATTAPFAFYLVYHLWMTAAGAGP